MTVADQAGYEVDIGQADAGPGQGDGKEDGCPLFFRRRADAPAQKGLFPFDDGIRPPGQGPVEDAPDSFRVARFLPADLDDQQHGKAPFLYEAAQCRISRFQRA
ncbi:hypothetical protein NM10_06053 [Megasphaera sp. NM10]|nr:hypothetical protein NM10_06053 [Megasphaera sp. NM10]